MAWFAAPIGWSFIDANDHLLFLLYSWPNAILGVIWLLASVYSPFGLLRSAFAHNLARAGAWGSILTFVVLMVGVTIRDYKPGDWDRDDFRRNLPAYRQLVTDAGSGLCSFQHAGKLHVELDFLACDKPILFVAPLGGFGSIWHGVIYDETDEIAKPPDERSKQWKTRQAAHSLACSGVNIPMGGHYYLAGGDYVCRYD